MDCRSAREFSGGMPKRLENISIVAAATVGSRVLGLLRDILLFALLGASALNSAFLIAFTLPNLFRRLLGEGALSSALVPMLSEELEENGKQGAFRLLNQVFARVFLVLLVVIVLGCLTLLLLGFIPGLSNRWYLSFDLGIVLLPYVIFVCLAAVLAAGLNVLRRFAIAALSQVWLNLVILFALGFLGYLLAEDNVELVGFLCGGVLVGGLLQLLIPAVALRRSGWRPHISMGGSDRLKQVWKLFLPSAWGAAILQVNFMVSRLIALALNDEAVSILYLANRLVELPLGIFAIAVTTVVFPELAKVAAKGNLQEFFATYQEGVRLILAMTLPAGLGLYLLREPILSLLFKWGSFGGNDVANTVPVLTVFAIGLPFYGLAAIGTRGFHALKDTRTPFLLAVVNFVLNIGFSLLLFRPFGIVGLAVANVSAIMVHSFAMQILLRRRFRRSGKSGGFAPLLKICGAAILMALVTDLAWALVSVLELTGRAKSSIAVFVIVPFAVILYFLTLRAFGLREVNDLQEMVLDFISKVFRPRV